MEKIVFKKGDMVSIVPNDTHPLAESALLDSVLGYLEKKVE